MVAEGLTEAKVTKQLKREETKEAAEGDAPLHGKSMSDFLTIGMQLEDLQ